MHIRYQKLIHRYTSSTEDTHQILNIPDWQIESGEQILIRGVSGSGKTTLFNITAGLMKPTAGTVWFDDQSLYSLPEAKRDRFRAQHIGYVFQTHLLMTTLSALENVVMPVAFANQTPPSTWDSQARKFLERVGLGDHLDYLPAKMSTGQRMRVTVARALVTHPKIILADEPTASLDSESANAVMDLIQEICQESGATLLVSSHDPALSMRFSNRLSLQNGTLAHEEQIHHGL